MSVNWWIDSHIMALSVALLTGYKGNNVDSSQNILSKIS